MEDALMSANFVGYSASDFFHLTSETPPANETDNPFINSTNGRPFELEYWWSVFDVRYLRHNYGWTATLVVAYLLILLIGVVGNVMVILVVVFRPQMRTVTNMFIMNLAVADLFVIVFCVPATLLANLFTPWILGSFMCKGVAYVQGVSVCASAYSLVAISLDRCKAIYRPLERSRGLSKSQALSTILLTWCLALTLTIPWAVTFDVLISPQDGYPYCLETWSNNFHGKMYFLIANLMCCYTLPLILISISNVIIWCHVSRRKVPDSASVGSIKRMHKKTRHGVRKMLGIVTLTFLLSWLPLYVLFSKVKFSQKLSDRETYILNMLMPLAQWLGSWNSSVNPVLYAFLNTKFREMFRSLLPAWLVCGRKLNGRDRARGATVGTTPTMSRTTMTSLRSSNRCGGSRGRTGNAQRSLVVSSLRGDEVKSTITRREQCGSVNSQVSRGVLSRNTDCIVTDV